MSAVVPDGLEVIVLNSLIATPLSMRLFSNNKTPAHGDTTAAYTQVAGGGYAAKSLTLANWVVTAGDPSKAVYNASQTWEFTGVTTAPGTIYGYYIVRVSDNQLVIAERFPSGSVPFVPKAGSKILVLPKITAQSEF
jgi:hypothetical protein